MFVDVRRLVTSDMTSAPTVEPECGRGPVMDDLSDLLERRLGGLMVLRLELSDLLERLTEEEHELAGL